MNDFNLIYSAIGPDLGDTATTDQVARTSHVLDYFFRFPDPWLLVFDNFDNLDYNIRDYFPISPNGSILITSRNSASQNLDSYFAHSILHLLKR